MANDKSLKLLTASTFKWNTIDKISSQVLYAITGIVLANIVSKEDFGLIGIILAFQAFASLFVDSGFSSALIQRKSPDSKDYSTVFFFNLGVSAAIYAVLYTLAPTMAKWFGNSELTTLSRVMFLTFIINATAIIQTNRLMKQMNVKLLAISDIAALTLSGTLGIILAVKGYGAWALVWQSIALSGLKSVILWSCVKWRPELYFSLERLKSFFAVGSGVLVTSLLNTISQNIYPLLIGGVMKSLTAVGLYTQADKWSKMGVMSMSQTLTSTFLPLLSEVNDDAERLNRVVAKTNRLCAYMLFPLFLLLTLMATPLFHILFGTKWDLAIPLFQLLVIRGIFVVHTLHCNNYILAMGKSKLLVYSEVVKDLVTLVSIIVTIKYGILMLVAGQLVASVICWATTLAFASRSLCISAGTLLRQLLPYVIIATLAMIPAWYILHLDYNPITTLLLQLLTAGVVYIAINALLKSRIQRDIFMYLSGKQSKL